MLRGLTTVSLYATDVRAAAAWYAELLGIEPYYETLVGDAPAYLEFRLGDYQHELGIIDARWAPPGRGPGETGVVAYWAVDDLGATLERLRTMGATDHLPVTEHGPGFVTASVVDPFGNVLGVMRNQHYLDVLGSFTERSRAGS